jgi:hypothetical protein
MSQTVRAKTTITKVIPNMMKNIIKKLAEETKMRVIRDNDTGIRIEGKCRYDFVEAEWKADGSNFSLSYDDDSRYRREAETKLIQNRYIIGVTAMIGEEQGFTVSNFITAKDGSMQITLEV